MAWTAPEVLAASSGCVGRALMGLPSESRTGAPCSGAGAGARCVAGDCMLRPAPGDRTPARDICRRRGGCYALRTLLASSPKFCFRAAVGWAARACGRLGVCRGGGDVSGGARGCTPNPKTKSNPDGAFYAGRVAWGVTESYGGGLKPLGRAVAGTRSTTRFLGKKQNAQNAARFCAAFLPRLVVGSAPARLCSTAQCYCASPAQESREGAAKPEQKH